LYQERAIADIRRAFESGSKAPILVLPTGAGKTVAFALIAESAARRLRRVLILVHRIELVDQVVATLEQVNIIPDVIAANYARHRVNRTVTVASVQTLVRRLADYAEPTLIIVDECHHATIGGTWDAIFRAYPNAKKLGVTASPIRLDGRGLAHHFDTMIIGPSTQELIDMGFLAPPRVFAPPTVDTSGLHTRAGEFRIEEANALMDVPAIHGDALSHYRKHADGKRALVFCTSVEHAAHVAEHFRKGGYQAASLNGGTDRQVRRMVVDEFKRGVLQILASCDLFSEGFDCPGAEVGIMLRPTQSLGLFLQQAGRILRPAPGKDKAIILDHVGNCIRHGLPNEPRDWKLTTDVIRKKKSVAQNRVCTSCWCANPPGTKVCIDCGAPFPVEHRDPLEEREGELEEVTAEMMEKKRARMQVGMAKALAQLKNIERIRHYRPGWAEHRLAARVAKQIKGGKP
jgi:superfamily II DNA or RNA helicase